MIYLMNSAVMPAGCYGVYSYHEANINELKYLLRGDLGEWKSTIGYPQNIDLIEKWTGIRPEFNRTQVKLNNGDQMFVMRLKTRVSDPSTKGALVSEDPADWEFAWVLYKDFTQ